MGDTEPDSLTAVQLRFGGAGNDVIENVSLAVSFNKGSKILNVRAPQDLGEYGRYVTWAPNDHSCRIEMKFLNPGTSFELEFLLSNYEPASVTVDGAAPGLKVRRREVERWEIPSSFLQGLTLKLMGVGYDPSIVSLNQIAEELRALRRQLSERE